MAGHSKWANIKRKKEAYDKIRGNLFSKLSRLITVAVIEGGGVTNPEHNVKLRLAIEKAKEANMPKDKIERAISRGLGPEKDQIREIVYEGFAPHNVSLIILATTDNPNRTLSEIRNVLDKYGGKIGEKGTVSYLFDQLGKVIIEKGSLTEEEIFDLADQIQAIDFEIIDNQCLFYIPFTNIGKAKEVFKNNKILELETIYKPKMPISLTPDQKQKNNLLINEIEELNDVHKVFSNFINA